MTITDAIARRDRLAAERKAVVAVADAATGGRQGGWGRQMRSELRWITELPVADLRAEADRIAREYRELDVRLQAANWTTELLE